MTGESSKPGHGRHERRSIRFSGELDDDINFPAVGVVKKPRLAVAETTRNLARKPKLVLDFLEMAGNIAAPTARG